MKYKNYQEVLKAPDCIGALKEYLKDKGMTQEEFRNSEERREAQIKAARDRFTRPPLKTPKAQNDSTKK